MANKLKVKRGTNLSNITTAPEAGELIYKSDTNKLYVGDGSTAANALTAIGGTGTVDTSGSPIAQEYARFTDNNTIEGRSAAGVRTDLGLNIGTNVQAYDTLLQNIADFPTSSSSNDGKVVTYQDLDGTLVLSTPSVGTITGVTGMTDNNVLTASGSTTISGESELTYNGAGLLQINRSGSNAILQLRSDTNNTRIHFKEGSSVKWNVGYDAANNKFSFYDDATVFAIEDGAGANTLIVDSNSRVGIGTASPVNKVHILGDANNAALRVQRGDNTGQNLYFRGYQMYNAGNHLLVSAADTKELRFGHISSTAQLVLDSSGNISTGVWQGTPIASAYIADNAINAAKLNVSGNGSNGQVLKSDGDGTFSWFSLVSSSNASTLDNLDSTQFLRSDTGDTAAGNITFTGKLLGNSATTSILNGVTVTNVNNGFTNDIGTGKAEGLQPFRYSNNTTNTPLGGGGSMADNANWGLSLYSHGTGGSGNYGLQMSGGDNDNQLFFIRRVTNGSFGNWFEMWHSGNDGAGSGLDADTLDGSHASSFLTTSGTAANSTLLNNLGAGSFLRSDANDTASGQYTFTKVNDHAIKVGTIRGTVVGSQGGEYIQMYNRVNIGSPAGWGSRSAPNYGLSVYGGADLATDTGSVTISGNTAWHAGNDGSGSTLDADLLDGLHGSSYWTKGGSWVGDLASNGYTRIQGVSNGGGEFVLALKNGQLNTLVDGSYFAYEGNTAAGGGFWSSYNSAYGNASGFKASATDKIRVQQLDGGTADLEVTGNIKLTNEKGLLWDYTPGISLGGYIAHPGGGMFRNSSGTNTGALTITLPSGGGPADMVSFWVDIFDYTSYKSQSFYIAGYVYQTAGSNEWINETAMMLTPRENHARTVRFGHDGTNHVVYIGELTDTWSYPQVTVRNVQVGYVSDVDTYNDNWDISFEASAFQNVDATFSGADTLPTAGKIKMKDGAGKFVHNTTSSRDKIRVWNSSNYAIGMEHSNNYGGLANQYAMTFNMDNTANRGFLWVKDAHSKSQGAMSLTTDGKLTVAHSMRLGFGESDTTTPGASAALDVKSQINLTNSSNATMVGLKGTNFGYSTSYKALQIGNTSGTYSIALGYDPSTNASASFTGDGREVIFRNGVEFTTPNAANNGFHNDILVLKDGNVGIGSATPSALLDVGDRIHLQSDGVLKWGASANAGNLTWDTGVAIVGSQSGIDLDLRAASGKNILFKVSSSEKMRIDSSGRVLIGDTSVHYSGVDLQVGNTSDSQNGIQIQTSTTGYGYVLFGDGTGADAYRGQISYKQGDDFLNFITAGGEKMRIDSSGNVGIGVVSPAGNLHVQRSGTGSGLGDIISETTTHNGNAGYRFRTNGTDRWAITTIGTNGSDLRIRDADGSADRIQIDSSGDAHFDQDVIAFSTTPSDIRLKENFEKIENGLDVVSKLEGHTFNWKKGGDRLSAGFKAQEVEKILPHLVDEKKLPLKADDDKEYKILRYEEMIPYLVEAIKEQQVQINELKTKIGEQNG